MKSKQFDPHIICMYSLNKIKYINCLTNDPIKSRPTQINDGISEPGPSIIC